MYIIHWEKTTKTLKESYEHILTGPRMEFYKHKENAIRAYELYKYPGYTISLYEAPDIDIEFSDNKVLGKSQNLTPLG